MQDVQAILSRDLFSDSFVNLNSGGAVAGFIKVIEQGDMEAPGRGIFSEITRHHLLKVQILEKGSNILDACELILWGVHQEDTEYNGQSPLAQRIGKRILRSRMVQEENSEDGI